MNPIEWLNERAPDFASLPDEERAAMCHFSLLWSFYEARVHKTDASPAKILLEAQKWAKNDRIRLAAFDSPLSYFRNRYLRNGNLTEEFHSLFLRVTDKQEVVEAALKGETNEPGDIVGALLIIVYRLRNNFFHGTKWAYFIKGQFDNFANANKVLMSALDAHLKCGVDVKQKQLRDFEKFDEVMTGLLAVPRTELDKKLEAEKLVKEKKNRRGQ